MAIHKKGSSLDQEKHFAVSDSSLLWQIAETCQIMGNSAQTTAWEGFSIYWRAAYVAIESSKARFPGFAFPFLKNNKGFGVS